MGYEEPTPENGEESNEEQEERAKAEDVGTGVDDTLEVKPTAEDWEKRFQDAKGPDAWRDQK